MKVNIDDSPVIVVPVNLFNYLPRKIPQVIPSVYFQNKHKERRILCAGKQIKLELVSCTQHFSLSSDSVPGAVYDTACI